MKPKFGVYGILMNGEEEKFRFEFPDKQDAIMKANELRTIVANQRYNPRVKSKYRDVIAKELTV